MPSRIATTTTSASLVTSGLDVVYDGEPVELELTIKSDRRLDAVGLPKLDGPGGPRTMGFLQSRDESGVVTAELAAGAEAPVWSGELYFEMHRGTLTSQIETKVGNRRCERLLREAELWWATGGAVPSEVAEELRVLWNDVLFPGACPDWVREEAEARARGFAIVEGRAAAVTSSRLGDDIALSDGPPGVEVQIPGRARDDFAAAGKSAAATF